MLGDIEVGIIPLLDHSIEAIVEIVELKQTLCKIIGYWLSIAYKIHQQIFHAYSGWDQVQ